MWGNTIQPGISNGRYCDGLSSAYQRVRITREGNELSFEGPGLGPIRLNPWNLRAAGPFKAGRPFALMLPSNAKARLVIEDDALSVWLLSFNPNLMAKAKSGRGSRAALVALAAIAAMAAALWLTVSYLPQKLVRFMPGNWRENAGQTREAAMETLGARCNSANGDKALGHLLASLAEGDPDFPTLSLHVYRWPMINAFALPGGRIVVSQKLIDDAERPEELAGVLAHEVGHVVHRDPEAQMLRQLGISVIFEAISTSRTASTPVVFEELRQSRDAEEAADAYASRVMLASKIDPTGLRNFFGRMLKRETKAGSFSLGQLGEMLSTHPGTEQRMEKIAPLPDGVVARPVVTDADWQALKKYCG